MKDLQNKIRFFDEVRGWSNHWNVKDLLLNITEEGGEFWNIIKWVDDEKQKELANSHKDKISDYIGDTMFLLLKIANQTGVDASQALQNTLDEYEKRMPPEVMKKVLHANKLAGGIDNKEFNNNSIQKT